MHRWLLAVTWLGMAACSSKRSAPTPRDTVAATVADAAPVLVDAVPARSVEASVDVGSTGASSNVTQLELDGRTACALRVDGTIRCWGSPSATRLGSVVPVEITGAPEAASMHLAAGVLALATRSGDVAIGPLALPDQPQLALVGGMGEVLDVRIDSATRAYVVSRAGDVFRLDKRETTGTPISINVIQLSTRELDSTDALHRDGRVTTLTAGKAVEVKGVTDAETLFATRCAHLRSGGIACWSPAGKPVKWTGPLNIVDRRARAGTTCALTGSGLACSGANEVGQLGTGVGPDRSDPRVVPLVAKPTAIAGGDRTWCARLETGEVACWGANDGGQLGDGTLIDVAAPKVVRAATSAVDPRAPEEIRVAGASTAMDWSDMPSGCKRPPTIDGLTVASAYAIARRAALELWFADFALEPAGYRPGYAVARGAQRAVHYALAKGKAGKPTLAIDRGRYRGDHGPKRATQISTNATVPADVLVETVTADWVCGTLLDPADPKQRTPFAARVTTPRYP